MPIKYGSDNNKHKGKSMDSKTEKDSGNPEVAPKQSRKKLLVAVVVLVVVVAAVVGGWLWYNKVQNDKKVADAKAAQAAKNKPLTPEQEVSKTLEDNVKKQVEILQKSDDTKAITESTVAAENVGRNLHETDLKE